MNDREKKLAIAVGVVVAVLVGVVGIRAWIINPLKDLDKRNAAIREKIGKAQEERRQFFAAEDRMKGFTLRTFADSVDEASAASGAMLTREIIQSGLKESDFTRLPAGPRKLRGASEIGWSVQGQGPLVCVVNLLHVLEESPHLHQVEGLFVTAGDGPGLVRVRFRYLTMVMEPAADVIRKPLTNIVDLKGPKRKALDAIVARDILRPYIKRPPAPPAKASGPAVAGGAGTPSGPESFRVVSLSEWNGQPEVHVLDTVKNKVVRYKPGDALAGGAVVMVDYRPLPMPGRAPLQSFSRVILRVDGEIYAVERGWALSEKRKLSKEEFPPGVIASQ